MVLVLAFALGDWVAVATANKRAEFFFKPATLAALIAYAALEGVPTVVIVALAASLAGDVFLMLPRNLFVFGLGSFLIAHIAYIVAFWPLAQEWWIPTVVLAPVAVMLVARMKTGAGRLFPAVGVYVAAILVMVVAAISQRWQPGASSTWPFAAAGGLLFMTSDALIGWTRFVQELVWAPLTIIVTYHLAQMLLVWSFVV